MGSIITRRVVLWASQECAWQCSGELSVGWMVDAWMYAHRWRNQRPKMRDVLALGRIVEPAVNAGGLRTVGVRVGSNVLLNPALVPAVLHQLVPLMAHLGPVVAFQQYEEVHPFRDGNGRTGSILFNWLSGSLPEPVHPPNLWGDPRRNVPGYPDPIGR